MLKIQWFIAILLGCVAVVWTLIGISEPFWLVPAGVLLVLLVFLASPRLLVPWVILTLPVTRICLAHGRPSGWTDRIFPSQTLLLLFLILWGVRCLKNKEARDGFPREIWPVLLLLGMGALAWPFFPHSEWGVFRVVELISLPIAFLASRSLMAGKRGMELLLGSWFLCGVFVAVTNIMSLQMEPFVRQYPLGEHWTLDVLFGEEGARAGGVGIHNGTALVLNMSLFVLLACLFATGRRVHWVVCLPFLLLMVLGELITRSRGGFYGMVVGLCLAVAWSLRSRRSVLLGVVLVIVFCVAAYFISHWGVSHGAFHRLVSPVVSSETQSGFSFRAMVWFRALDEMSRLHWLGLGLGGWAEKVSDLPHGHSIFFTPIFEFGPLGLFLWSPFLFFVIRGTCVRARMCRGTPGEFAAPWLAAGLISCGLQGIASFDYSHLPYWVFLGGIWTMLEKWAEERCSIAG